MNRDIDAIREIIITVKNAESAIIRVEDVPD